MKEEYRELEVEVIRFEAEDVITTSVTETPVMSAESNPTQSMNIF